jgi:hypothetical protein
MLLPIVECWKNILSRLGGRAEPRRAKRRRVESRIGFEQCEKRLMLATDVVIDDTQAAFQVLSLDWSIGNTGYLDQSHFRESGSGESAARFRIEGLPTDRQHQLFLTWPSDTANATNAPLTVTDGTSPLGTLLVNQAIAPDDTQALGAAWESLGVFQSSTGVLEVEITNDADGTVVADAVRLVEVQPATATILLPPTIIDNGGVGYATASSGYWSTSGGGYSGGHQFEFGSTGGYAEWTFADLPDGEYRVSATWLQGSNRGTNVPYTVSDGSLDVHTTRVNQRIAPAPDVVVSSKNFEHLGDVSVVNGVLVVRMTNSSGDGRAIADAIRIQHLGPAQEASDIRVFSGTAELTDGASTVNLGTTFFGTPTAPTTLTVKNVGLSDLVLAPLTQQNMPAGVTLVSSYGSTTLARGASTTFQITLAATSTGTFSGILSLPSNDPDEASFEITLAGVVNASKIIDNGGAGFALVSANYWSTSGGGYGGNHQFEWADSRFVGN